MEQMILWSGDNYGFGGDVFLAWDYDNALARRFAAFCSGCGHPEWANEVRPVDDFVRCDLVRTTDKAGLYQAQDRLGQYIWLRPADDGLYAPASGWMADDPNVDGLLYDIRQAVDLDDLADALDRLAAADPAVRTAVDAEIDWANLPVFGGEEPADTAGVWSWDETRLLVGDSQPFRLVPR